jgi:hypothetical protein
MASEPRAMMTRYTIRARIRLRSCRPTVLSSTAPDLSPVLPLTVGAQIMATAGVAMLKSRRGGGVRHVVAFEIIILHFDAFDRPMIGNRWIVTGTSSGDWQPLKPGETGHDGLLNVPDKVFTAVAYTRTVRLGDGTIWRASEPEVASQIRKALPRIRDVGTLSPGPEADRGTPRNAKLGSK